MTVRVACLQLTSTPDLAATVESCQSMIEDAHREGAAFVCTPENTPILAGRRDLTATAVEESRHPAVEAFRETAAKCGIWVLVGSVAVAGTQGKLANRSLLINDSGEIRARYDKIHMFDVDLDGGERYRESDNYQPGSEACLVNTPWGGLGMTICYDLRFPALYRTLAQAGAQILTIPSAFTRPTGKAHWHVLLRARAIETGCFVLAPAQCGVHYGKRATYGHSLIIDPWGEVLADAGDEKPGLIFADLDLTKIDEARGKVPSLHHDRAFVAPVPLQKAAE